MGGFVDYLGARGFFAVNLPLHTDLVKRCGLNQSQCPSTTSSARPGQIAIPFIRRNTDDHLHPPLFFRAQVGGDNLADQVLPVDGFHLGKSVRCDDADGRRVHRTKGRRRAVPTVRDGDWDLRQSSLRRWLRH